MLLKKKDTVFLRRISSNSSSLGSRFKSSSSVTSDAGCLDYRVNLELVFVPLPQEDGLPGFRGVKSTGEHPKEQSLRDTVCQRLIQAIHSIPAALLFKP